MLRENNRIKHYTLMNQSVLGGMARTASNKTNTDSQSQEVNRMFSKGTAEEYQNFSRLETDNNQLIVLTEQDQDVRP